MNLIPLPRDFFARDTNVVSTELIGKVLYFQGKTAIITETESYIGMDDPACHAARGRTKRTDIGTVARWKERLYLIV